MSSQLTLAQRAVLAELLVLHGRNPDRVAVAEVFRSDGRTSPRSPFTLPVPAQIAPPRQGLRSTFDTPSTPGWKMLLAKCSPTGAVSPDST